MFKQLALAFTALVIGILVGGAGGAHLANRSESKTVIQSDVASLRAQPERFSGKVVRLTGKLDECYAWECSLCPENMTTETAAPNKCLALEFRPLVPGTGFGEEEQEKVMRFASVTLVGKFDPSCWKYPCLDRGTVLSDVQVESVQKRRSSHDGLWLGSLTQLQEATDAFASAIIDRAREAGFPKGPPMKAFSVKDDPSVAVVCWMAGGDAWPTSFEGALYAKSTTDFYSCNKVRKTGSEWTVQVQDS